MERGAEVYFLNDPLEVEIAAVNVYTNMAFLKLWSKQNFIKVYGPTIVSKEEFIRNFKYLGVPIFNTLYYTNKNKDRFYTLIYLHYKETMKGNL